MNSKFAFNLMALLVCASIALSACGTAATQAAAPTEPAPTQAPAATAAPAASQAPAAAVGEGEVDIVAWPGYIERGANAAAPRRESGIRSNKLTHTEASRMKSIGMAGNRKRRNVQLSHGT